MGNDPVTGRSHDIAHPNCNYFSREGGVCNKCGQYVPTMVEAMTQLAAYRELTSRNELLEPIYTAGKAWVEAEGLHSFAGSELRVVRQLIRNAMDTESGKTTKPLFCRASASENPVEGCDFFDHGVCYGRRNECLEKERKGKEPCPNPS